MYSFDVSLPLQCYYDIVRDTKEFLKDYEEVMSVTGFGHLGNVT